MKNEKGILSGFFGLKLAYTQFKGRKHESNETADNFLYCLLAVIFLHHGSELCSGWLLIQIFS